jgi:hypothetical protein
LDEQKLRQVGTVMLEDDSEVPARARPLTSWMHPDPAVDQPEGRVGLPKLDVGEAAAVDDEVVAAEAAGPW